jgi:hypothetical protein
MRTHYNSALDAPPPQPTIPPHTAVCHESGKLDTYALKVCLLKAKGKAKAKSTQSEAAALLAKERLLYASNLRGVAGIPELHPRGYGDDKGYR